jgi:hypothetical protein
MKHLKTLTALVLLPLVSACAPGPNAVTPYSVGTDLYSGMSCSDINDELRVKNAEVAALSSKQKAAATGDALGVFFILLPVSSLTGGDVQGELAQAKGEQIALESASRHCSKKSGSHSDAYYNR